MRSGRLVRTLLVAALAVACGSASQPAARPTQHPTTPPGASPTPSSSSAADSLAAFFRTAEQTDQRLRSVAALVNGSIGTTSARFSSTTRAAVATVLPDGLARSIPAGLPDELQQAVLVVHSELVGRAAAFKRVRWATGTVVLSTDEGKDLLRCLGNGAPLARRFAADLRAARALADRLPAVAKADPQGEAALALAARLELIRVGHNGCDACGGGVQTALPPVALDPELAHAWGVSNKGWTHFGAVDELPFRARWVPASAHWQVELLAC